MVSDAFYDRLIADVLHNQANIHLADYEIFRRYYHKMAKREQYHPFFRHNWVRRTAPMANLLQQLPSRTTPYRVLDAGCGVGTESIFWATLNKNAHITGVDLSEDRLKVADARLTAWAEREQRPLPIQFLNQSIFDVLKGEPFDCIWSMESISHIDPAEDFLTAAFENLSTGGSLVISDSHLLNPAMLWRLAKMRTDVPVRTQKKLADGKEISYAHERLFAVPKLSHLLQKAGFSKVDTQLSIFFPPSFVRQPRLFNIARRLDSFWDKLPLFRQIGGIYTVTAHKS